jgi:hypothetical protein
MYERCLEPNLAPEPEPDHSPKPVLELEFELIKDHEDGPNLAPDVVL